jgi:hypothetical protein
VCTYTYIYICTHTHTHIYLEQGLEEGFAAARRGELGLDRIVVALGLVDELSVLGCFVPERGNLSLDLLDLLPVHLRHLLQLCLLIGKAI